MINYNNHNTAGDICRKLIWTTTIPMQFNQCCHSLQSYDYLQYPALAVHPARYASWLHAVSLSYPIPHYSSFTKTLSSNSTSRIAKRWHEALRKVSQPPFIKCHRKETDVSLCSVSPTYSLIRCWFTRSKNRVTIQYGKIRKPLSPSSTIKSGPHPTESAWICLAAMHDKT